jgi:predicted transcriptional regulator of viral defense system
MGSRAWNALYEVASTQEGLFTTEQAASVGLSPQHLHFHVLQGNARRLRRGVYRIVNYPLGDHEDLVEVWLWSKQAGVFSHETALSLHGLSDVLPSRTHMTVPPGFRRRRESVPAGVVLHVGEISEEERAWVGPVPVTGPARTLMDCALAHLSPDLLLQAIKQARTRGLVPPDRLSRISRLARVGRPSRSRQP